MLEHKGETVRLIWLPEPIRMKLQQHPMTRGAQVADIRLSENRYVRGRADQRGRNRDHGGGVV